VDPHVAEAFGEDRRLYPLKEVGAGGRGLPCGGAHLEAARGGGGSPPDDGSRRVPAFEEPAIGPLVKW